MAAYMIVLARIADRQRFIEVYGRPTAALLARFGGEYMVRTQTITTLEGEPAEGWSGVVSKWPSRAAIDTFWNSPDYAPLRAAREGLAECRVMVMEDPS